MSEELDDLEELKSIQADLDSLLDRLAKYMGSDKLSHVRHLPDGSKRVTHDAEPQPSDRQDAARAIFQYATTEGFSAGRLDFAILETRRARKRMKAADAELIRSAADASGNLRAALAAIDIWNIAGHPIENHHMLALWRSTHVFLDRRSEYFGEEVGLNHPKRSVKRNKLKHYLAADEAWGLHLSDPKKYPVDDNLFREAAGRHGLSGGVVKRAYYSEEMKAAREEVNRWWRNFSNSDKE